MGYPMCGLKKTLPPKSPFKVGNGEDKIGPGPTTRL